MRFSPRTVARLWDVHAWVGILTSLILAAMFFGGTVSLFHHDLEVWQDPPTAPSAIADLDGAMAGIDPDGLRGQHVAAAPPSPHASRAVLYLPDREPLAVGPDTGQAAPVRSRVGELFFHLHFLWHEAFPAGMVIAGVLGVLLLLAIVTGVVIHLKDLRRQAFRFRPALRARYLWSDLHKVLGVWGLPFQIMIALTGALMCLAPVLVPRLSAAAFDGDRDRGQLEIGGEPTPTAEPSDAPATMLSFAALTERAQAAMPGLTPTYIAIDRWGQQGARATIYGDRFDRGFYPGMQVILDAHDGALVARDRATPAHATTNVVYGLHFASFGGLALKLLYALLGLAGWLTILSGNWIWIESRASKRPSRGNALLGKLTLGVGGGITVATAVILWINRLATPGADRPGLEVWGFFAAWLLMALIGLALPPHRRSWSIVLGVAGLGLIAVPLLSIATAPVHLLAPHGDWRAPGVDLGIAGFGVLLCAAARAAWSDRSDQP